MLGWKLSESYQNKEIQQEMEKKVIYSNQSGKGCKAIYKALGLQRTTTIYKLREHATILNLQRSGWPTKITLRVQQTSRKS